MNLETNIQRKNILHLSLRIETYNENQNKLHAVSCTQQDRKGEPSVKTLLYPLSAEFCSLSGRTLRRTQHQSEEMET